MMHYNTFSARLHRYLQLYDSGLKKQANAEIADTVRQVSSLPDDLQNSILFTFLSDYLDNQQWEQLRKRGNADIPYALKEYIRLWITPRCETSNMPELRWYYELFRNDRYGSRQASVYLNQAYASPECDQKTTDLLFDSYTDTLAWGAHHFPEGCILTPETVSCCFQKCEEIRSEKPVSAHLIQQYHYYKALYKSYEQYKADGRTIPFEDYLRHSGLNFPYR